MHIWGVNKNDKIYYKNFDNIDKEYKLYNVFKFLKDLKLPNELEKKYAHSLKAVNPSQQKDLDLLVETALENKFILNEEDLKSFNESIQLQPNGLIGTLDYYRAVIDFLKLSDAVNKYHRDVRKAVLNDTD